jgi:hypothetical protein
MKITVTPHYPQLTQIDVQLWRIDKSVEFTVDGTPFTVPKGVKTDGASVPRAFWSIMPPLSNYTNAAIVHDWLYQTKRIDNRKIVDKIFLYAMAYLGVSRWKRNIMYRAVRMFGGFVWNRRR